MSSARFVLKEAFWSSACLQNTFMLEENEVVALEVVQFGCVEDQTKMEGV